MECEVGGGLQSATIDSDLVCHRSNRCFTQISVSRHLQGTAIHHNLACMSMGIAAGQCAGESAGQLRSPNVAAIRQNARLAQGTRHCPVGSL